MARSLRIPAARWVALAAAVVFGAAVLRWGWVSDDAFITLRTVDNFLAGHGLRWNVADRVQAYTHPLWMLLLLVVHGLTGEPWFGTMALGVAITVGAVAAAAWHARSAAASTTVFVLLGSKAFVDFATSGLENPLTHLLLLLLWLQRSPVGAVLVWSLALCNRLDAAVLFTPLLAVKLVGRELSPRLAWGLVPLLGWSLFATLYYGSPLPNTAFAKLGAGVPLVERIGQGLLYFQHLCVHDPVTATLVVLGPVLAVGLRTREALALGLGGLLHTLYVVWAGGDFMAGRLFTPAAFATVVLLTQLQRPQVALVPVAGLSLSLLFPQSPLRPGSTDHKLEAWQGIVDERAFYWRGAGLPSRLAGVDHPYAKNGARQPPGTKMRAAAGLFGYHAGPQVHILDPLGLGDPLLARLPAQYDPNWRVGHYRRAIPKGYDPGLERGPTELPELWSLVRRVTRGPVFDPQRLASIPAFHLQRPTPFDARFPGLARKVGRIGPRGMRFEGVPAAVEGVQGDRWRLLFVTGAQVLAAHDLVLPATVPQAPPGTELTLLFPANRREARQVLHRVD